MLLTVLAIKIEDGIRAPAFYSQERVGLGGRTFRVLKSAQHARRMPNLTGVRSGATEARPTRSLVLAGVIRTLRINRTTTNLSMSFVDT